MNANRIRTDTTESEKPAIKVFRMNDCDWMAGASLEACVQAYLKDTGMDRDELDGPEEMSDEAMDALKFYDEAPFDGTNGESRSFREQLARLIAEGAEFPRIFASTEY